MRKDIERIVFDRIDNQFDGTFFLSYLSLDSGWPIFFKIDGDSVWTCNSQKVGWSCEGPGEPIEKLEHISASTRESSDKVLVFCGATKKLEVNTKTTYLYYGR